MNHVSLCGDADTSPPFVAGCNCHIGIELIYAAKLPVLDNNIHKHEL